MNEKIRELADPVVITTVMKRRNINENIKELMYEANKSVNPGAWTLEDFSQKFAELIVRECAKFLDENSGYDCYNNVWHPEPEDLLKHFGVEE